jgi:hypothetical protein
MPVEVFYNILLYISIFSVLLPIIKFFIIKNRTDAIKLLFALLCVSFAADITNELYIQLGHRGAEIVNIYFSLQFILVSIIFTLLCEQMKDLVYTIGIAYIMFLIINTINWQPFNEFQSNTAVLQDVIIIAYTFVYFYFVLKELEIGHLLRYSSFWIVTSLFLYSLLSVYIFALTNYVFAFLPEKYAMLPWTFHDLSNILKNIMFFLAMVYTKKRTPPAIRIERNTRAYQ